MIKNGAIKSDNFEKDDIKFSKEFINYFQDFNDDFLPAVIIL